MHRLTIQNEAYSRLASEAKVAKRTPTAHLDWILEKHLGGALVVAEGQSSSTRKPENDAVQAETGDDLSIEELMRREKSGEWTRKQVEEYMAKGSTPRVYVEPPREAIAKFGG